MKFSLEQFITGDIGLSSNKTFLSNAIRFFENLHTGKAKYSHSFLLVGENLIVEALTRVKVNDTMKYDDQDVVVYRIPLTNEERKNLRIEMLKKASDGYGWTKIPMFALDGMLTGVSKLFGRKKPVFFFTKHARIFNIPVCSQLVVYGIHKFTTYRFKDINNTEVDWRVVSPDYLEDLLKMEHNNASVVCKIDIK